ncbi:glycosyltransferase family 2 protein [Aestuariivirga sp.]|jgi:tetratricopeptide (TPR) repeat protein|uniref:glycosyltransferase family 2 protein n=1 Tax=Aestuariivirga sp. TaxID=2650926 RepID=UPI003784887C
MTDTALPMVKIDIKKKSDDAAKALRTKDWLLVFNILEDALKDDGADWPLQPILDLGAAASQLGRFDEASLAYEMVRARDPQNIAAWKGAAFAASRRAAWEQAVELWQGCIALHTPDKQQDWWWSSLGEALGKLERWEEADNTYAEMRKRWPSSLSAFSGGAFVASRRDDWVSSAQLWQGCLSLSPPEKQQPWWWSSFADALTRLGRNEEAESAYKELRKKWPEKLAGWQGGARLASRKADWGSAAALWCQAMARVPDESINASSVILATLSQLHVGNISAAKHFLDRMLRRWPDEPSGMQNLLGCLVRDFGARRSARILDEIGLLNRSASSIVETKLIDILLAAGRHHDAAERIAELKRRSLDNFEWFFATLSYHRSLGDDRAAFREVENALCSRQNLEIFTADDVAVLAYQAAMDMTEAAASLAQWFGEDVAKEAVHKRYSLPTADHETSRAEYQPPLLSSSWSGWNKTCREKFKKFQLNRQYSTFLSFVESSVKRASPLRLRRLLAVASGRFPNSSSATMLRSIIERKTVPASDPDQAFASRWRLALPPPELSIANQLNSRPWRRLVCVVPIRDEDDLLQGLINHYRSLGVESFILIDNGSANDPASLLKIFTDCEITLVRCSGRFSDARHGVMWINEIAELEICDWLLLSDCDERFIYPGSSVTSIGKLLDHLDRRGDTALFAPMLDVFDATFAAGDRISSRIEDHVLINANLVSDAALKSPWITIQGGIRNTISSNLEKVPLLKVSAGVRLTGNHHVSSCNLAETRGALLHLKLYRDRSLLDMQPKDVVQESRIRDRARNCVARHLAFQSLAHGKNRASPFQVEASEVRLMKIGYMCADPEWRAQLPFQLPEDLTLKTEMLSLREGERVSSRQPLHFRSVDLPDVIRDLCSPAVYLNRSELRVLIRAHFARIVRRDVKLAVLLPLVVTLRRNDLARRILRLLKASMQCGSPCVLALRASANQLKPYRELRGELLEMAFDAGDRTESLLIDLSECYAWSGQYALAIQVLSDVDMSAQKGAVFQKLRALIGLGDWEGYTGLLNAIMEDPTEQPYWRLLSFISIFPFPAKREKLLAKLLGRLSSSRMGPDASVYLSILHLLGQQDDLASAFSGLSDALPDQSRRYFERVIARQNEPVIFNRLWCLGLSKTGTTSFHDYCNRIGLLSAHYINPALLKNEWVTLRDH